MRGLLAASALAALAALAVDAALTVNVDQTTGAYQVLLDGGVWLGSNVTAIRNGGKLFTSAPGGGLVKGPVTPLAGNGGALPGGLAYTGYSIPFTASDGTPVTTSFYVYPALNAIVFAMDLPNGLTDTAVGPKGDISDLATAFPTFGPSLSELDTDLGYMAWADCMSTGHINRFMTAGISLPHFGSNGGATILFNASLSAIAFSSLDNKMNSGFVFAPSLGSVLGSGILGSVTSVPAGWRHTSVLVGGVGVNDTMNAWGDVLLLHGQKNRTAVLDDFQTSYLSYWTDNGAYYYYHTMTGQPLQGYEQTMIAVKEYETTQLGLPVRAFMFDSWWYFKAGPPPVPKGAMLLWEPIPEVFPDGFSKDFIGLPMALHNRYFDINNSYVAMGYEFINDPPGGNQQITLPVDEKMFRYIMEKPQKAWGMTMYEQDWLITVYEEMLVTQQNITACRSWLHAMNDAAASLNLTIQLCMPLPIHMLESTGMGAVTNARASGDYHPGQTNFQIGLSSIFYQSIGVQPSKDDFWTTAVQPGSPYGDNPTEPNWQLQAIVATLSTGPVGPSDMINGTNATLVLSTCRAGDGLLLRPDRPATVVDSAIAAVLAQGVGGGDFDYAQVVHTYSAHAHKAVPGTGVRWHYVYAAMLASSFTLGWTDIGPTSGGVASFVSVDFFNPRAPAGSVYGTLTASTPITIPAGQGQPSAPPDAHSLRYMVLAPVLPGTGGWVLIGEEGKIAMMSRMRVDEVELTATGFSASVHASGPGGLGATVGGVHASAAGGRPLVGGLSALPRAVAHSERTIREGKAPVGAPGETSIVYLVVPPAGTPAADAMLGEGAGAGAVAAVTCSVAGGGIFRLACDSATGCTCAAAAAESF